MDRYSEVEASRVRKRVPAISERFDGKDVLVTGATGFVGKVLLEKLLRSCPGILSIRILLRDCPKRGTVEQRIETLRRDKVFDVLREENPDFIFKIRPLRGDITESNLGIDEEQLDLLKTEVSFVFNCAANIRFGEDPKKLFTANLLGVKNVLDVVNKFKNLEAFVHVSTAYAFCNRSEIDEQLYPERLSPQHFLDSLWMNNDAFATLCKYYPHGRPSLYQYTKALAEIYVNTFAMKHQLPAIIVRPAIITASLNEPVPGWIDNINGPSGFLALCGQGIVKVMKVNENVNADWVPVDTVVNALIVAAHYIAMTRTIDELQNLPFRLEAPSGVPIINCTVPEDNAITWSEITKASIPLLQECPSQQSIDAAGGTVTNNRVKYELARFFRHIVPAMLADGIRMLAFNKPTFTSKVRKIHRVMDQLEHFTTTQYSFRSRNLQRLGVLGGVDFNVGQKTFCWSDYLKNYALGVRRYVLKEEDETIPQAVSRMKKWVAFWWISRGLLAGLLFLLSFCTHLCLRNSTNHAFYLPSIPAASAFEFLRTKFSKRLPH